MAFPLISVIIPTHNRSELVKRAVTSVLAQTYRPLEIIIVDDDSSEDIRSAVSKFAGKGVDINILRNVSNVGGQQSRLKGAQAARGEIVAQLDSDDWWEPNKLVAQYAALQKFPEALISCRLELATSGKVIPDDVIQENEKVENYIYIRGGFLQSSTFLCGKELLIDGLSHSMAKCHDDTYLAMVLKDKGTHIVQLDSALAHFDDFPRNDRLSISKAELDQPILWFYRVNGNWSREAKAGYLVRDTARRYLNNGMRLKAFVTLLRAYNPRLPIKLYIKTFISIIFGGSPLRFFRKAKSIS